MRGPGAASAHGMTVPGAAQKAAGVEITGVSGRQSERHPSEPILDRPVTI